MLMFVKMIIKLYNKQSLQVCWYCLISWTLSADWYIYKYIVLYDHNKEETYTAVLLNTLSEKQGGLKDFK